MESEFTCVSLMTLNELIENMIRPFPKSLYFDDLIIENHDVTLILQLHP